MGIGRLGSQVWHFVHITVLLAKRKSKSAVVSWPNQQMRPNK